MIYETLLEFLANGADYQLVSKRDGFEEIWKKTLDIDNLAVIDIIGGVDTSAPQSPTAVVDVLISSGALSPAGDEVGMERFVIYHRDFEHKDEAIKDVKSYLKTISLK